MTPPVRKKHTAHDQSASIGSSKWSHHIMIVAERIAVGPNYLQCIIPALHTDGGKTGLAVKDMLYRHGQKAVICRTHNAGTIPRPYVTTSPNPLCHAGAYAIQFNHSAGIALRAGHGCHAS